MTMCRTCLKTPATKDITTLENDINEDNKNCIDVMVFVLNIKVKPNSKITTNLCNNCYRRIISFYKFKALSLKNDAYLNSLDPVEPLEGQKHSLYVDEDGIKHENFLDSDELGPSVVGDCNTEIKADIQLKNEVEADVKDDDHILGDIESDEEPLNVIKKNDVEADVKDDNHILGDIESDEEPLNVIKKKDVEADVKDDNHILGDIESDEEPLNVIKKNEVETDVKDDDHILGDIESDEEPLNVIKKNEVETDVKDDDHILGDIESDEEPLNVIQNIKYEFVEDDIKDNEQTYKKTGHLKKVKRQDIKNVIQGKQMCEECGMSVLDLKQHSLRHQPRDERTLLQCKACTKMFLTRGGRRRHYNTTHLGLKSKCDICNKEVIHLSTHKLQMHDRKAAPFGCASCARRFVSRGALERHVLAHTENREIECDICHGKFRTKDYVANHIRRVHYKEKNHQCEICSKAFFDKSLLQDHLSSHSKTRQFVCTVCGKACTTKDSLRQHRHVHNDVRKYSCDICDKSFKVQSYLRAHILSHTKKKAYPCQFCDARFGRVSSRRRHELTHHNAMSSNHKQ